MKRPRLLPLFAALWLLSLPATQCVQAQTASGFTYQGRLTYLGQPIACQNVDLTFELWTDALTGGRKGNAQIRNGVRLTDGLFNVKLDFGANVFDGSPRWLEITLKDPCTSTTTVLKPRQPLCPVPYALYAMTPAGPPGSNGVKGDQGIQGVPGQKGDPGIPGSPGTPGATGARGATGATGAPGAQGPNGNNGIDGKTVRNGAGMPANALGVEGDFYIDTAASRIYGPKSTLGWGGGIALIGPQGLRGTDGIKGAPGIQGSPGTPGATGARGATGATGATGAMGAPGAQGPKGNNGTDGKTVRNGAGMPANALGVEGDFYIDTAASRIYGPKSTLGWGGGIALIGPQGLRGANGIKGDKGDPGIQGSPGTAGATGARGATGATGATGAMGLPGAQGPKGDKGDKGDTGAQGLPGSANAWSLLGNGGTVPGVNFLGTTDPTAFEIRVGGQPAIQVYPGPTPSIAGGYSGNNATGGGVVAGGGASGAANGASSFAFVGGGVRNSANPGCVVGGGYTNSAAGSQDTVGGGVRNNAEGQQTFIGGGVGNTAFNTASAVAGGEMNTNGASHGFIGGGLGNMVGGPQSSIVGGEANFVGREAGWSFIGGGIGNQASNSYSTLGGGYYNRALGGSATISGGYFNTADGLVATIGGGDGNRVSGGYSTVPGGRFNTAAGEYSLAMGTRANAAHHGSFVWSDVAEGPFGSTFSSTGENQFAIRARGGVQLDPDTSISFGANTRQMLNLWGTNYGIGVQDSTLYFRTDTGAAHRGFIWYKGGFHSSAYADPGNGGIELMHLVEGGLYVNGTFVSSSDRNAKQEFASISPREVLEKVASLDVGLWSYKNDPGTRHIGPVAQDFYAAFGVGPDDKHIATIDADGVALAAIKGLDEKLREKDAEIQELKRAVQQLTDSVNQLSNR